MKRTISSIGVLLAGVIVVFSPVAGLFEPAETAAAAPETTVATTTSSAPGPDPDAPTETSKTPVTSESTTTTTQAEASDTVTIAGPAVDTRFGEFQVEIVIEGGELVDIITLAEPGDGRSQSINDRAIPQYEAQAIETQSADLDVISGATVTWEAWTASLAAAFDTAGLS